MPARAQAGTRRRTELVDDVRVIRHHCDLTVLAVSEIIGEGHPGLGAEGVAAYIMLGTFAAAAERDLLGRQSWLGFIASPQEHWQGLSLWICLSSNVKPVVVEMISERVKALGSPVAVEGMHTSAREVAPVVYAGPDGCELLIPKQDMDDVGKFSPILEAAEGRAICREVLVAW